MISPGSFLIFFFYFLFFGLLGGKGAKNGPKWKIITSVIYIPYLRNSIAYDHDFSCPCVKWYLQGFFFQFFKIFIFRIVRVVKGQKKTQNDKKICLLHSISEKPYIIWLSFMVNIYKMIISWSVFLIFENFNFLGAGGKRAKSSP